MAYIFQAKHKFGLVDRQYMSEQDVECTRALLSSLYDATRDEELRALVCTAQGLVGGFVCGETPPPLRLAVHRVFR